MSLFTDKIRSLFTDKISKRQQREIHELMDKLANPMSYHLTPEQEAGLTDESARTELTQDQRTKLVAFHEAEVARLQGEVSKGNWQELGPYALALAKHHAAELGVDCPELDQVETFTPQVQADKCAVEYLESRCERLKAAMQEAMYWMDLNAPNRAQQTLQQALTS